VKVSLFGDELADEVRVELLRRCLEVRFGDFRPFVPEAAFHEKLQRFHYTRWQLLLQAVLFGAHRLARK